MLKRWVLISMLTAVIGIVVISQVITEQNTAAAAHSIWLHQSQSFDVLQTKEKDVTGDNRPDIVTFLGKKSDKTSLFYNKIYILVEDKKERKLSMIPLEGGYNPQLQFCDFNNDKVADLFVSSETGGSGGISIYHIYTVKNNTPESIQVPGPLTMSGMFKDNYAAEITIKEQNKVFTINLKDRKQLYDEAGIYTNGKLLKPTNVMVNDYNELKPIDVDKDGICELWGTQRISGIANADSIAFATSVWKWDINQWKLLNAKVEKISSNRTK